MQRLRPLSGWEVCEPRTVLAFQESGYVRGAARLAFKGEVQSESNLRQ
jgi:hypothetical protein